MNSNLSPDAVRALAYQLWVDRGCAGGSPEEDWFRAEEILSEEHRAVLMDSPMQASAEPTRVSTERVDKAVEESFPASDPPAVHLKDDPPVNAGEKWKAADKAADKDKAGRGPRGRRG